MNKELPVTFSCAGHDLLGIVHQANTEPSLGVVLIVGGPQYRVGSHRQFILLARMLAANGIPVLRFDYRGMGDAEGDMHTFTEVDDDIAAAIDMFIKTCPTITQVVLWGLCDAASAALFYAYQDERVKGLVLLNPWLYTEQGAAKTYLKHYYLQRLLSKDLWHKVFSLNFDFKESFLSLLAIVKKLSGSAGQQTSATELKTTPSDKVSASLDLPQRLRACLQRFKHPVLLLLSGRDLTADEFKSATQADPEWQQLLADQRMTRHDLAEADHTFSSQLWRDQVADYTLDWLVSLSKG